MAEPRRNATWPERFTRYDSHGGDGAHPESDVAVVQELSFAVLTAWWGTGGKVRRNVDEMLATEELQVVEKAKNSAPA